jgi:hypothetical protein
MGPPSISKPFSPFSFSFSTGAHKLHFPNHFRLLTQSFSSGNHFHCSLAVHLFITHSGTHAHSHICQIQAHIFDPLQIVFTLGIWLFYVQVLDQHLSTSLLQVYTQHWHVVSPTVLHSQSHPLILAFRIPISGSAVLTPPFAFLGYCHPVAFSPT